MITRLAIAMFATSLLLASEPATGYQLFPGDRILVQVFGHADLAVDARVPQAGGVTFPLIGAVERLAGRTPQEVADEVAKRLADGFIKSPSVTVQVAEYGLRRVVVMGAVRTPGPVSLDPLKPSVCWQAIGSAGGFEEDADRAAVVVLREEAGQGRSAMMQSLDGEATTGGDQLVSGDIVIVPRTDRVYVLGEVNAPRAIALPTTEVVTVSKAISMAGGFARFAKEDRVQLLRRGAEPLTINAKAILAGDAKTPNPALRAGDTLFVPESRF